MADPGLNCDNQLHSLAQLSAAAIVGIITVGVPVMYGFVIYRFRPQLSRVQRLESQYQHAKATQLREADAEEVTTCCLLLATYYLLLTTYYLLLITIG